jgi:hypothetical protein
MRNSLVILASLALAACASTSGAPPARVPVSVPAPISVPAPPRATLVATDAAPLLCYSVPAGEQLADTIDAAMALNAQAPEIHAAAVALDAEAGRLAAALQATEAAREAEAAGLRWQLWSWRIGVGLGGVLLLGVAL